MRENSLQVSSGALKRFYIANASNLHTLPKTIASKNFPPADAFFHWAMLLIEELPTWWQWGLAHPSAQLEDLWITGILHLLHLKGWEHALEGHETGRERKASQRQKSCT